ncbi:MAG: hypothetical protein E6Q97_09745 [Desulfurellales bacterium]|nr:MAG: hypothetical protein E6Q97_09745 [Desulfurellales bacterium]
MVGGIVIEVCDHPTDRHKLWVNCADRAYRKQKHPDECAIYVEKNETSARIQIGDGLWWQGRDAMWTPQENRGSQEEREKRGLKCGVDYDIRIPRIGYSGVAHPHTGSR